MTSSEVECEALTAMVWIETLDRLDPHAPRDLGSPIGAIVRNQQDICSAVRSLGERGKSGLKQRRLVVGRDDDHGSYPCCAGTWSQPQRPQADEYFCRKAKSEQDERGERDS